MSSTYIPGAVCASVRARSDGLCEYCLLHERDIGWTFHLDHVIAEKHAGPTDDHNLSNCCPDCNRRKGSDIATMVKGDVVRLFNPRIDLWHEHFSLDGAFIRAKTPVGEGTIRLLGLNDRHRVAIRRSLIAEGRFPGPEALEKACAS
ncbi:MAG TPA: HNH endonuclease [Verrucomicrobiales bacterium]|nr:HNH endonuclease [Verrucomicrobiales bacterium]